MNKKKVIIIASVSIAVVVIAVALVFIIKGLGGYRDISVFSINGSAGVERESKRSDIYESMHLENGDVVDVNDDSFLRLLLDEDKVASIEEKSVVELAAKGDKKSSRTSLLLKQGEMIIEVKNKLDNDSTFSINTGNSCIAIRGTVVICKNCIEDGKNVSYNYIYEGNADFYECFKENEENVMIKTSLKAGEGIRFATSPQNSVDISLMQSYNNVFDDGLADSTSNFKEFENVEACVEYAKTIEGIETRKIGLESFDLENIVLEELEGASGEKVAVYLNDDANTSDGADDSTADAAATDDDSSEDDTDADNTTENSLFDENGEPSEPLSEDPADWPIMVGDFCEHPGTVHFFANGWTCVPGPEDDELNFAKGRRFEADGITYTDSTWEADIQNRVYCNLFENYETPDEQDFFDVAPGWYYFDDSEGVFKKCKYALHNHTDITSEVTVNVGDNIFFGSYEQDNKSSNGKEPIEWRILNIDGDKALLISEKALDCRKYTDVSARCSWSDCTLRSMLNGNFLPSAFTEREISYIYTSTISSELFDISENDRSMTQTETQDRIFLLSYDEVERYFANMSKKCEPTAYAKAQGRVSADDYPEDQNTCSWLLRSHNESAYAVANVYDSGAFYRYDDIGREFAIRPAMWVNIRNLMANRIIEDRLK